MPENTGTPEPSEKPADQPQGSEAPATTSNELEMTTEAENLKNRNKVLEELLRQVNIALDGSNSIFPGSRLHEDIHLAVIGQRL